MVKDTRTNEMEKAANELLEQAEKERAEKLLKDFQEMMKRYQDAKPPTEYPPYLPPASCTCGCFCCGPLRYPASPIWPYPGNPYWYQVTCNTQLSKDHV